MARKWIPVWRKRQKLEALEYPEPKAGERFEHIDGGTVYVISCDGGIVKFQRRPFGDSLAESEVAYLWRFRRFTFGKLS